MHLEIRTPFPFLVLVALLTTGCGINSTNRFQMSFLPAAPHAAGVAASELPKPPEVQPNIYLRDMPAFLLEHPQLPTKKTRGDALILQAEECFQRGKRLYQSADIESARREFDTAFDLMLEASEHSPADRQDYERRLEELADLIHRFDLADLGAAAVAEGKFEKAPLEDILQM